MSEFVLPTPNRRFGRDFYHLTQEAIDELILEGLRQHLYLGGQPGTHNRLELRADKKGLVAVAWTET
jgi:hypothetical protein